MKTTDTITAAVQIRASYRDTSETIAMAPVSGNERNLTDGQLDKAAEFDATHFFVTGDVETLPKFKLAALAAAGWEIKKVGHTTYRSSTWAARPA